MSKDSYLYSREGKKMCLAKLLLVLPSTRILKELLCHPRWLRCLSILEGRVGTVYDGIRLRSLNEKLHTMNRWNNINRKNVHAQLSVLSTLTENWGKHQGVINVHIVEFKGPGPPTNSKQFLSSRPSKGIKSLGKALPLSARSYYTESPQTTAATLRDQSY